MKRVLSVLFVCFFATLAKADLFTFWFTPPYHVISATNFVVPANTTIHIVSAFVPAGDSLSISNNGATNIMTSGGTYSDFATFVGPAMLTFSGETGLAYFTAETNSPSPSLNSIPSTAVVIPADTNGPVNIILESSTDMVNWTPALPGTYGTTATNRFFRVRATR